MAAPLGVREELLVWLRLRVCERSCWCGCASVCAKGVAGVAAPPCVRGCSWVWLCLRAGLGRAGVASFRGVGQSSFNPSSSSSSSSSGGEAAGSAGGASFSGRSADGRGAGRPGLTTFRGTAQTGPAGVHACLLALPKCVRNDTTTLRVMGSMTVHTKTARVHSSMHRPPPGGALPTGQPECARARAWVRACAWVCVCARLRACVHDHSGVRGTGSPTCPMHCVTCVDLS